MAEDDKDPFESFFRIELDPARFEDAAAVVRERLEGMREQIQEAYGTGRYTKVRISFRGKPVMPDIPLGAFLAAPSLGLLLQPMWVLLATLGAKSVLDFEFLHLADELVAQGNDAYLAGEVAKAEQHYRDALDKRPDDPSAHYHLGVLLRVVGRTDEAREHLHTAAAGPEGHRDVVRAAEALSRLQGKRTL